MQAAIGEWHRLCPIWLLMYCKSLLKRLNLSFFEISISTMVKKILLVLAGIIFLYLGYMSYQAYSVEAESMALLHDAKNRAVEAVEKRASEFKAYIDSKKTGAKPFSQDVIGLKGTWVAVKCALPGVDGNCYKNYITDKFSEHIFTPDDFRDALNRAIQGGVQDIDGIENQLAVSLKQVIEGKSLKSEELPEAEAEFKRAIEAARSASNDAVLKEVGGLAVSEAVSQIFPQVLIRIGVSSVILAAAGANAWWTLGGSLVIGLAVNAVWTYFTQPAAGVEKIVLTGLGKISADGSSAIRDELTKKVTARGQLWEATIKQKALQ